MRLSLSLPLLLLLPLLECKNTAVAATPPHSVPSASIYKISSLVSLNSTFLLATNLRGGGDDGDYSDGYIDNESYDEYDSEEEDLEPTTKKRNQERQRIPKHPARNSYHSQSHRKNYPNYGQRGRGSNRRSSSSSTLSSATNAASAATKLATKSLSVTGSLAWNALVKTPGKLAFHVIRPKHVDLVETFGLWRLDQQVIERSNRRGGDQRTLASVATIEFARPPLPKRGERGRPQRGPSQLPMVIVRHSKGESKDDEGKDSTEVVYRAPYTFVQKNRYLKGASLSSFQTSFVAPAFLVGENQTRLYGYKGTWQRKLADKSVIKLKGKIYQVHKQKFGKRRGEYVYGPAVGTFVMRRRILVSEEEYGANESYDGDSEYDDDEEYDDDIDEYTDDGDDYE